MKLDLDGRVALVTGGSRGIGRAICERLVREGAIVATCARTPEALDEAVEALSTSGTPVYGTAFDVRTPGALEQWVSDTAASLGGIDIIVSNVSTRVDPSGADWWQATFEADLMQHVRLKNLAQPHLAARGGGAMVFIASIAASMTTLPPYEEAYGAMKAGLVNLVGQWGVGLASKGIRVNAVSPGPIDFPGGWWDMIRTENPEGYTRAQQLAALGRLGRPEEVADAVAFLASPRAGFITGANLRVDGGMVKSANF